MKQGDNILLHLNLNEMGTRTLVENYNAMLLYQHEGTWWFKTNEGIGFIVKKEAAL